MRRTLPTFLIIGVAKAGTTSVYAYLKEHPQIYMSPIKETNYFAYQGKDTKTFLGKKPYNEFPVTTMEQYLALFEHAADKVAIGEASPLYFESPVAAARIKRTLPEAKADSHTPQPCGKGLLRLHDGTKFRPGHLGDGGSVSGEWTYGAGRIVLLASG
jgi:hypothetical protein